MVSTPLPQSIDTKHGLFVQFGCGLCAPETWVNFDSSPAVLIEHLPIVGHLMPTGDFGGYPPNVRYADILKGLPLTDNSVDLLYCSHVLEHLTVAEVRIALKNCYQYLKPGGIFRLVLPDLEPMALDYINSQDTNAVHDFMRLTWLGEDTPQRSNLISTLKKWLRRDRHLWMWDYKALAKELGLVGFRQIKRVRRGDSGIPAFNLLEDPERWIYELGIQCQK
jgi:SAM-dependent methyltransferase